MANKYSKRVYTAVAKGNQSLPGVRLGAACIDAHISAQVVAGWLKVSRQAIYDWFHGRSGVAERHREKVEQVTHILLAALDAGELPAKDLPTALAVVKRYKERVR